MMWAAILATAVGAYLLKLAGLSIPASLLERRPDQLAVASRSQRTRGDQGRELLAPRRVSRQRTREPRH